MRLLLCTAGRGMNCTFVTRHSTRTPEKGYARQACRTRSLRTTLKGPTPKNSEYGNRHVQRLQKARSTAKRQVQGHETGREGTDSTKELGVRQEAGATTPENSEYGKRQVQPHHRTRSAAGSPVQIDIWIFCFPTINWAIRIEVRIVPISRPHI